jgi:MerR family redox-sensitive transcriptional activator SoxR
MDEKAELSIGQLAAEAGIRASSIRYYESIGVLPEPERRGGMRRYGPDSVRRLEVVAVAQQAGFSLAEIAELLRSSEEEEVSQRLRALARRKLPEVEALIARAEAMKSWLQTAQGCGCSTLDICALFDEPPAAAAGAASTLTVVPAGSRG